ncbi:MAG: hypothetical protein JXR61_05150 [Prolixibacteraceae bacterium]|nr:hypothetical protein [Prolixibacteraceae bacterium]
MKTRIKFFTLVIIALFTTSGIVSAIEKTKEYNEKWPISEVSSLDISNKFGEVKVANEGGSEVTINVLITVEAGNESAAEKLLDQINVAFTKSGTTIKAVTNIDNGFKSQREFSIDYIINVPENKNLRITNKYGNTFVNKLHANGNFDISYGSFSANELLTPENGTMKLDLAYGNASIDEATVLEAEISYSPVSIDRVKKLTIDSKYSQLSGDNAGDVVIDSRYDQFSFGQVESLSAETKYSHIDMDKLTSSLKIDAGYGSIQVDEVSPDFESISISNSYGQISLGLNNASYTVDATCQYCGISYPEDNFQGNKINENNTREIKGTVGSVNGGSVTIESRYGDIRLRD